MANCVHLSCFHDSFVFKPMISISKKLWQNGNLLFSLKNTVYSLSRLKTESKLWLNKQESSRTKQFCWDFFLMPKMQGVYGISYKENIFEKTNLNEPEWMKINKKWIPTISLNENCSFPTRKMKTERERERERDRERESQRDKIQLEKGSIKSLFLALTCMLQSNNNMMQ